MKFSIRAMALVIVVILILGMILTGLPLWGRAADTEPVYTGLTAGNVKLVKPSKLTSGNVTSNVELTFQFYTDNQTLYTGSDVPFFISGNAPFSWDDKTELVISGPYNSGGRNTYTATFKGLIYNGSSGASMSVVLLGTDDGSTTHDDIEINVSIPSSFFRAASSSSGSSTGDEETPPTSDIVVENVTVKTASGQKLDKVDKDTGPITVEIIYSDIGLQDEGFNSMGKNELHAFITTATGFKLLAGSRGTLTIDSLQGVYPRFKAVFKNVEYSGGGKDLGFRVQYDFFDYHVKGTSTATLFQIESEEEEKEGDLPPVKPKIVIDKYSYGEDQIVAGNEFNLDISFRNTSSDIAVEGVTMTLVPSEGLAIAAASNTVYIPNLGAGQSMSHTIALRTLPSTAAGSVKLDIKFSFQYVDKKTRPEGTSDESVSIPITQIDRFAVDPITDYTQYLTMGEEGYLTVPIINRGNSATKNISAVVRAQGEFVAPTSHFGNLEPGKNGTIDISITVNQIGEFHGEVVVQYEDENMKQKELATPFSIMVNEPYVDQPEMPDMSGMEPAESPWQKWFRLGLCVLGGLLLAAPLALYIIKRVKAKGSEEIDEDF